MEKFEELLADLYKSEDENESNIRLSEFSGAEFCEVGTLIRNNDEKKGPFKSDFCFLVLGKKYYGFLDNNKKELKNVISTKNIGKPIIVYGKRHKCFENHILAEFLSNDESDIELLDTALLLSKKTPTNKKNSDNTARSYRNLSQKINDEIYDRLNNAPKTYNDSCVEHNKRFFDLSDLIKIYENTKSIYPISSQQTLDSAIAGFNGTGGIILGSDKRDHTNEVLQSVLSISPSFHPTEKSKADIKAELDKLICFREDEKEAIANAICVSKRKHIAPRILLVGAPGTGKNLLANAIGFVINKNTVSLPYYSYVSLIDIAGCDSTFHEASNGAVGTQFKTANSTDICMIFQGIDEANREKSKDGLPETCLEDMVKNGLYYDKYWDVSIPCKATTIICTAESTDNISESILTSFDKIIYLSDYSSAEKSAIARNRFLEQLSNEFKVNQEYITSQFDDLIDYIVESFCFDDGLDPLQSALNTLVSFIVDENYMERGMKLSQETIDAVLKKKNLANDDATCILMKKQLFDKESLLIIKKMIADSKKNGDESMLAKKQLNSLATMLRNTHDSFHFLYEEFIAETNKTHSALFDIKDDLACLFNSIKRGTKNIENLLLISAPGQGKTTLVESAAKAVRKPFFKISCNGATDPSFFKGTISAVKDGGPGIIVKALEVAGLNSVILLDEIDKMHPAVMSVFLDLLDEKKFSCSFFDGIKLDLSSVVFIASANYYDKIAPEILDRFSVILMKGYSKKTQKSITKTHIIPSVVKDNKATGIVFTDDSIDCLIDDYIYNTGARQLKANVNKIVKKLSLKYKDYVVTPDDVRNIIGAPVVKKAIDLEKSIPGKVNALAVLGNGLGSVTTIECVHSYEDSTTGSVQGSCLESLKVARTVLSDFVNIQEKHFHLHFGAGETGIKKDGASAGLALFLSLYSCEKGLPIDPHCAFTGELSLLEVYPVGGVEAKVRAAIEAGCTKVFVPLLNYNELSSEVLEEVEEANATVIPVSNVREILDMVFINTEISAKQSKKNIA